MQPRPLPLAITCVAELHAWLDAADAGDSAEYHTGFLAVDVDPYCSACDEGERSRLLAVARFAARAADADEVHLVQRRIGPGQFAYLAIRRELGRASRGKHGTSR